MKRKRKNPRLTIDQVTAVALKFVNYADSFDPSGWTGPASGVFADLEYDLKKKAGLIHGSGFRIIRKGSGLEDLIQGWEQEDLILLMNLLISLRKHRDESAHAYAQEINKMLDQFEAELDALEQTCRTIPAAANQSLLREPVTILDLSVRALNVFEGVGIQTIGDLCKNSAEDLLSMRNFGRTTLGEIERKLGAHGLGLVGSTGIWNQKQISQVFGKDSRTYPEEYDIQEVIRAFRSSRNAGDETLIRFYKKKHGDLKAAAKALVLYYLQWHRGYEEGKPLLHHID